MHRATGFSGHIDVVEVAAPNACSDDFGGGARDGVSAADTADEPARPAENAQTNLSGSQGNAHRQSEFVTGGRTRTGRLLGLELCGLLNLIFLPVSNR